MNYFQLLGVRKSHILIDIISMYIRVCHIFLDFKVSRYIEGYSFWTKIEVVLTLPCWLSQFS